MSMRTNLDILADYPDLADAERAEVLEDLRREHARLQGQLVMLRSLAQGDLVEADAFGPVDLTEVVDAAVADVRRRHADAKITLRGTPGLRVHGWEQGLRSVVDNLLSNAYVHGRPDGEPARIEVTLRPSRSPGRPVAELTVEDRGPGIPPGLRANVLRRYHRRPDSPGSGLGLTLIAQQIALHRGSITILDRPDGQRGARFAVRLPALGPGTPDAQTTLPLLRRDWLAGAAASQEFHKDGS